MECSLENTLIVSLIRIYIYIYIIRGTMGGGASVDKRRVIKLGGVTTLTNDAGARFTRPLS